MKKTIVRILCVLGILIAAGLVVYFYYPGAIVKTFVTLSRISAGLSRNTVQVDDHRWVYLDGGKGDAIIFLHGYGDTKEGWADFPVAFMDSYRVIIPDLPGHGENSRIQAETYDVPNQSKWLDRFVALIGIKSFHLCGESMGGEIAAYYAGDHPEKVKSVMIMGAPGVRGTKNTPALDAYDRDRSTCLCWRTEEEFRRTINWAFDRPPKMPRFLINHAVDQGRKYYSFNKKVFDDMISNGRDLLENRLSRVTAPALIVWGKNDRIIDVSSGEGLNRGIKNSRLEILDGGHMIYMDQPEKTRALYKDFLKTLK